MAEYKVIQGECLEILKKMKGNTIQCCITSPPYYGLRDYQVDNQIGLEKTPEEYISKLVEIFREVRRVLRDDGTLWVNIGDSYNGSGKAGKKDSVYFERHTEFGKPSQHKEKIGNPTHIEGLKPKDLIGIPWMLAFALRTDGWYLRQDIIWAKGAPMPESVRDRCTKSHEYIFLLSKSKKYYFDYKAIQEPAVSKSPEKESTRGEGYGEAKGIKNNPDRDRGFSNNGYRNKRSVWFINTKPYKGAHFATFPPELIRPCIKAGSKEGDIILDPFAGSGTTGQVALEEERNTLLIELNPEYIKLIENRLNKI